MVMSLARSYGKLGMHEEQVQAAENAVQGCLKAIENSDASNKKVLYDDGISGEILINSQKSIAFGQAQLSLFELAHDNMRQALEYALEITGGESATTSLVLRDWALIYEAEGDEEGAEECINKADEIESK